MENLRVARAKKIRKLSVSRTGRQVRDDIRVGGPLSNNVPVIGKFDFVRAERGTALNRVAEACRLIPQITESRVGHVERCLQDG